MVLIVIVTVALSAAGGVAVLAYLSPERPRRESFRPRVSRRGRRPSAAQRAVPHEMTLGDLFTGTPRKDPAELDWEQVSSADWSLEPVDLVLYPEPPGSTQPDPQTEHDPGAEPGDTADKLSDDEQAPTDDTLPDEPAPGGEPAPDEATLGDGPVLDEATLGDGPVPDEALVSDEAQDSEPEPDEPVDDEPVDEEPGPDEPTPDDELVLDDEPGPDGPDRTTPDDDLVPGGPGLVLSEPEAVGAEPDLEPSMASVEPHVEPDREPVRTS